MRDGARLVRNAQDVLEELNYAHKLVKVDYSNNPDKELPDLSENELKLYTYLKREREKVRANNSSLRHKYRYNLWQRRRIEHARNPRPNISPGHSTYSISD